MSQERKKSSLGTTIGYGLGSMVRTGENLWGFYLSYFLVTVVGINAAAAGTISGAALLIASVWCIFIGYISDNSKSKHGKRRPIMLASIFPTVILMTLIFIKVDFGQATAAYYAIVCILFYIIYYTFLVPYDSLGAELTVDYNARTKIRSLCTVILYVSVFVGGTLVMYVQTGFANGGIGGEAGSWSLAVLISCTLPMLICGLIAWAATKGKEPIGVEIGEIQEKPKENIFKSYMSVLKIKPFLGIAIWSLLYFIGNTVLSGFLVYFGVYVLGLSEATASTYFTISMVVTILMAVPANWLAGRFGKKNTLLIAMCVYAVCGLTVIIKGPSSYLDGAILSVGYGITNSIALIVSYSMVYDIGELNEFKFGDSKVAACVGTYTLGMGLAQAIGYSLIGYILAWAGFDAMAAQQPDSVITAITLSETVVPLGFMVLSAIAVVLLYKITPKNYAALVEALEAKKEGRDYSIDGFREIL
ncbi:MFS transporter [Eubacteriales bacterium DFI.9.88]|nr:MFS transporter [Eubacteriales bacterium DFI.9.88]